MRNEHSNDHTFLLCELAAILAVLASAPMAAAQSDMHQEATATAASKKTPISSPQRLTYEHVYGNRRISVGGFAPTRMTWIDDEHYIQRESGGWQQISARTGIEAP